MEPWNYDTRGHRQTQTRSPAVNPATINLIKKFEGFVPSPSPDPIGLSTVGYGHRCQKTSCAEVPYTFPLTKDQASTLLRSDLKTYERCITRSISSTVTLNDNQYGALVSFAYNVGCKAATSSTLPARLNGGQDPNTVAREELPRWTKANGVSLEGLVNRRRAEVNLFQTPSDIRERPSGD